MPFDNANIPESKRTRVLKDARAYITPPERHALGSLRMGHACCALGAIGHAISGDAMDHMTPLGGEVKAVLAKHTTYHGYDKFNCTSVGPNACDESRIAAHNNMLGHGPTLEMFDAAIAESEAMDARTAMEVAA